MPRADYRIDIDVCDSGKESVTVYSVVDCDGWLVAGPFLSFDEAHSALEDARFQSDEEVCDRYHGRY